MNSSEKRRNDPQIRAAVTEVLDARAEAILKAEKLVQEALSILVSVPHYNVDDPLYTRSTDAVSRAVSQLSGDKHYILGRTDTYVGNIAANELGRILQEELDSK